MPNRDDEEEEKEKEEILKILQLDPVTVSRLFKMTETEEPSGILAQGEMKIVHNMFSTDDQIARAISKIIVSKLTSGMGKFSVTPSTITEAWKRLLVTASLNIAEYMQHAKEYVVQNISYALNSQSPQDRRKVIEYLNLYNRVSKILIIALNYAINDILGILVINMPLEITSQVYKHMIIGIDHIST